jgi:uncharacterized protein
MSDDSYRPVRRPMPVWKATMYFVTWVLASSLWLGICYAAPNFPPLTGRVVDQPGLLTAAEATEITDRLEALEKTNGTQMVVAIINSLDGYDIRDYGYQLGRHWQIGQKGVNNGVILLIVPSENRVSIEVGYGLEGVITDAAARLIIANAIVPAFREGRFADGIMAAVGDITALATGEEAPSLKQAPRDDRDFDIDDVIPLIFLALVIWMILRESSGGGSGGRRRRGTPIIFGPGGFGSGSGGFGGGGGFSGGGGSFGGGGASGSW